MLLDERVGYCIRRYLVLLVVKKLLENLIRTGEPRVSCRIAFRMIPRRSFIWGTEGDLSDVCPAP